MKENVAEVIVLALLPLLLLLFLLPPPPLSYLEAACLDGLHFHPFSVLYTVHEHEH